MAHIPVLKKEVLEYLLPKPNENFIDCTIGGGGHALDILEKIKPNGKILGIDLDENLLKSIELKDNLIVVCGNYAGLKEIVKKNNFQPVSGILLDLGMSSWHLEESGRGFTFLRDEALDMRYNSKFPIPNSQFPNDLTAGSIINAFPEKEIEKILREYGEEKFAKRIAQKIVQERKIKPIKTTFQLAEVIKKAVPARYQYARIHPATRTFQALRIAVNGELDNLKKVLPQILEVLEKGGRVAIISFHSLEDRIVKDFLKNNSAQNLKILTKKPVVPSEKEIKDNPRSRSAKLRAALKV